VINFVLRQNYQGAQVTATGGGTTQGGAGSKGLSAIAGMGDLNQDRYNVMTVVNWQKDNALFGGQRAFASSGVSSFVDATSGNSFPANIAAADGTLGLRSQLSARCVPIRSSKIRDIAAAGGALQCVWLGALPADGRCRAVCQSFV
jgi:hypothetical protein